ncbi:hypothetical protein R3P38DRAFT_3368450 [Favolaschia claudopus]|uniref:Uncharacterized protein n=1 Tax=Favolaschia claudopus TaxID=2862362 RepID=A0AAW0A670_9AGAR
MHSILLLAVSIGLLGSSFSVAAPQIVTLKHIELPGELVGPSRTEISALGPANAQGATTYVEVVELSSLVKILPTLTTTLLSTPTTLTQTFVEDASGVTGTVIDFVADGVQTAIVEECQFGEGKCEVAGFTTGLAVPFTTLTAPSPGSTGASKSGGGEVTAPATRMSVILPFAMLVGGFKQACEICSCISSGRRRIYGRSPQAAEPRASMRANGSRGGRGRWYKDARQKEDDGGGMVGEEDNGCVEGRHVMTQARVVGLSATDVEEGGGLAEVLDVRQLDVFVEKSWREQ